MGDTIVGMVKHPVSGCREKGLVGFIRGIIIGLASIVVKPTVGMYDLLISILDVNIIKINLYQNYFFSKILPMNSLGRS
jgi:hypothetical protein